MAGVFEVCAWFVLAMAASAVVAGAWSLCMRMAWGRKLADVLGFGDEPEWRR